MGDPQTTAVNVLSILPGCPGDCCPSQLRGSTCLVTAVCVACLPTHIHMHTPHLMLSVLPAGWQGSALGRGWTWSPSTWRRRRRGLLCPPPSTSRHPCRTSPGAGTRSGTRCGMGGACRRMAGKGPLAAMVPVVHVVEGTGVGHSTPVRRRRARLGFRGTQTGVLEEGGRGSRAG